MFVSCNMPKKVKVGRSAFFFFFFFFFFLFCQRRFFWQNRRKNPVSLLQQKAGRGQKVASRWSLNGVLLKGNNLWSRQGMIVNARWSLGRFNCNMCLMNTFNVKDMSLPHIYFE